MSTLELHPARPSRVLLFCFQLLLLISSVPQSNALDSTRFTEVLNKLANEDLGVADFQAYLDDNVKYAEAALEGDALVQTMARSLQQKFRSRMEVVESLRDTIQDEYASFSSRSTFSDCCDASLDEEDTRFQNKVNLNEVCIAGEQINSATKFVTNKVRDKMKENLQAHPTIRWQYFASEEGVMTVYPSFRQCDDSYDPRFRPIYVSTATPEPKDVVVVIDTSGSMSILVYGNTDRLKIAISAANTVIDTLGPNDRIGIVSFESNPTTPPGDTRSICYSTMLAAATPVNRKYLRQYVNNLRARGGTQYSKALRMAFELIERAGDVQFDNRARDKVILFLTDGKPQDTQTDILETIREENSRLQNKVVILTYGIGEATEDGAEEILTSMAQQHDYDHSAGEITEGKFEFVANAMNLRRIMGSYYDFFSKTGDIPKVNFVVPYFDAFGLGMVTSACLPVFHFSTLVGVTCVDITMSDLLSDVTYFKEGELSYAFMIDSQARLLMHPLLPQPYAVEEDPIFVQMPSLETFTGADEVMQGMIRGEVGQKVVSSVRVVSRGDAVYEGVETMTVPSTYYWHPVEGTEFSVCLAVAKQDQQASVEWSQPYEQTFTYHRLDLQDPDSSNLCNYYGHLGLKDRSTVQFSPEAFTDPYEYLSTEETATTLNRYSVYMTGKSRISPGIKEGVRETVSVTAYFDQLLNNLGQSDYVVWRYIGTRNGVFRVRPGSSLDKEYDHTMRPWYQRSFSQKGTLTMSTPYIDGLGAGYVLTLSKTLYESRENHAHSTDDLAIGVMAMDFSLPYMYHKLLDTFPECSEGSNSCFIVEKSGFIVVHEDFVKTGLSQKLDLEHVHITVKEPSIAESLYREGAMKEKGCINFETLKDQFFWTISILNGNKIVTDRFELHEVEGSNVFLVVNKFPGVASNFCTCSSQQGGLGTCYGGECECPCSKRTDIYQYCHDSFDLSSDTWPPCSPRVPSVDLDAVSEKEESQASRLESCFNYDCAAKLEFYGCANSAGCSWCSVNEKDELLTEPYCGTYDKCPFGVVDEDASDDNGSSGGNAGVIAGAVVAVLVVLLVVGAVVVFIYFRKKKCSAGSSPPPSGSAGGGVSISGGRSLGYDNPAMQPSSPTAPSAPAPHLAEPHEPPPSYDSLHQAPPAYGHAASYDNKAFGAPY